MWLSWTDPRRTWRNSIMKCYIQLPGMRDIWLMYSCTTAMSNPARDKEAAVSRVTKRWMPKQVG